MVEESKHPDDNTSDSDDDPPFVAIQTPTSCGLAAYYESLLNRLYSGLTLEEKRLRDCWLHIKNGELTREQMADRRTHTLAPVLTGVGYAGGRDLYEE